jgi:alcohol dehydrogenase
MLASPMVAVAAGLVAAVAVAFNVGRLPQRFIDTVVPTFLDVHPAHASLTETMTAISYERHGDTSVLSWSASYPRPIPNDDQVLVEIKASALNPADFKFRRNPVPNFILPKPKIPGMDFAGIIIQVGSKVKNNKNTNFQVGDRVAGMVPGLGSQWGTAADYVAIQGSLLGKIGDTTSFEMASSVPLVGLTTVQALRRVKDRSSSASPNDPLKILIQAGAGGVGTFAIQYCKHVLGMQVATTASSAKTDLLKSLGADLVIDYRTTPFETVIQDYDIVLDTMSFAYEARTLQHGSNVLKADGTGYYLNIFSSDWYLNDKGVEVGNGVTTLWNWLAHKLPLVGPLLLYLLSKPPVIYEMTAVMPNGEDVQMVLDLVEQGTIQPVIDKTFKLSDIEDAYKYLEQGHATGKVVLLH